MIIDVHNHFIGNAAKSFLLEEGKASGVPAEEDREGNLVVDFGFRKLAASRDFFDPELRLEVMNRCGIDAQLLTVSASHTFQEQDQGFVSAYLKTVNDGIGKVCEEYPGKFFPTAVVSLRDVEEGVREAERTVNELKARAVFMTSNVEGEHLDDRKLDALYEAVQDLGVPLIIHPTTPRSRDGMDGYHLFNLCGFQFDHALNLARMVLSGVYERFPRLRVFYTHGGGPSLFLLGRWDHAHKIREDTRAAIASPPSAYFDRIWVGTVVFNPRTLGFVIDSIGADHVCLGSDYPYDMEEPDPVGLVQRVESLSESDSKAILGGNALTLFGLPC